MRSLDILRNHHELMGADDEGDMLAPDSIRTSQAVSPKPQNLTPSSYLINSVMGAQVAVTLSVAAVLTGWGLSLAGALNRTGYVLAGSLIALLTAGLLLQWRPRLKGTVRWRRYRRGLPAAFVMLACFAALGGALYPPSNIDALTYRLPRILQWLAAGRWHWIDTVNLRMNYSAAGTDWLLAPFLVFGDGSRLMFLVNCAAFLLLPGLVFVWLRQLGAGGRVAWRWMWLVPGALTFALQAGSIANDMTGAVYFLAAMVMVGRAAKTGKWTDLILACAAMGLATGTKASNLALAPMWFVLAVPALGRFRQRPAVVLAALLLGLAVSVAPTLALNAVHTGHWSGDPSNQTLVRPGSPGAALAGNAVLTGLQNVAPPVFPWAGTWNAWSDRVLIPHWRAWFGPDGFPRFTLRLGELPQEEWAGLGLVFLILTALEWRMARGHRRPVAPGVRAALWAGACGVLLFGVMMGSEMPARLLTPFCFVPIAAVAVASPLTNLHRRAAWRSIAALVMFASLAAVVLNPARPLWPALTVLRHVEQRWPDRPIFARAALVYGVYRDRPDYLAPLRSSLPAEVRTLGFLATGDDAEWSLWRPIGSRQVVDLRGLADPRLGDVDAVVVRADGIVGDRNSVVAALSAAGFVVSKETRLVVKASRAPETWMVAVRRHGPPGGPQSRE